LQRPPCYANWNQNPKLLILLRWLWAVARQAVARPAVARAVARAAVARAVAKAVARAAVARAVVDRAVVKAPVEAVAKILLLWQVDKPVVWRQPEVELGRGIQVLLLGTPVPPLGTPALLHGTLAPLLGTPVPTIGTPALQLGVLVPLPGAAVLPLLGAAILL